MAASSGDVLALTRKLYAQTGDRDQTVAALTSMGYSKGDATAAVDQVAPAPAATPPAPAAKQPASGPKKRRQGASPKPRTPPAQPSSSPGAGLPSPTLRLPRRPDRRDVAGFGFGCVLFVLFTSYLHYGPGGPTGWLKAKFLNQPYSPPVNDSSDSSDGAGADDLGLTSVRPATPNTVNG